MPTFRLAFYAFEDIAANSGDPLTTTSTTGTTGSFTVDPDATVQRLFYDDDEDTFHDAFIDEGTVQQTLTEPLTVNGVTYPIGAVVELEFSVTTTTGEDFIYIRVGGTNVGIGGSTFPVPGTEYTIQGSSDGQLQVTADIACFTSGTPIATANGSRDVETLRAGDEVRVFGNRTAILRAVLKTRVSLAQLLAEPKLAPVRVAAGCLGAKRDLAFSPQHRLVVRGRHVRALFDEPKVLVPAKALVNGRGITQPMPDGDVTFVHLIFDRHELVRSAGLWSESFLPTERNLSLLSADAREELHTLFPAIFHAPQQSTVLPARRVQESRPLAERID